MRVALSFHVNGKPVSTEVEPDTLLSTFIREHLRLTGTHVGCDTGQCGACAVLVDGRAAKSCNVLAAQMQGSAVTTIEGVTPADGSMHPMQAAFKACHGPVRLLHARHGDERQRPRHPPPARQRARDPRVPEVSFTLESFLKTLSERLEKKSHAVIVAAEGAGQDILGKTGERDASGNIRLQDIGIFLREQIIAYFKRTAKEINLKYIDPSYTIRSVPADANDSAFCLLLGQNAVHAGMSGRTNIVVGFWISECTHVPISMAVSARKKVDPEGWVWRSVITVTGQPKEMR